MGLFGTVKTSKRTVEQVYSMIEKYFHRRRLNIEDHLMDACEGYGWWITERDIKVYVFIQEALKGKSIEIRCTSPIVHFPIVNRDLFCTRLLEINRDLSWCCLAAFEDVVLVSAQRPIEGLDQEELDNIIWTVSQTANELEDRLSKEFGARVFQEPM